MPWLQKHNLTKQEVAEILAGFLAGSGGRWDWDNFTSGMSLGDPYLEKVAFGVRDWQTNFLLTGLSNIATKTVSK